MQSDKIQCRICNMEMKNPVPITGLELPDLKVKIFRLF